MSRLQGKHVVVTGAGKGLGRVLAERLVAEGAVVVGVARNAERLERVLAPLGDRALALAGDLGEPADVDRIFGEIDRRYGKLDILINNAAIYDFFRIDEADPARIRATLDANLLGPMLCIRAATPLFRRTGAGDIINMTSESVRNPYAFLTAYAATKAGLENLSYGLRTELRPDNIRVTAVRLGVLDDPERDVTMDPGVGERFVQQNAAAMAASGGAMSLDSVATALIGILTLPEDVACDVVELRPRT